jgi:hypothetical protein
MIASAASVVMSVALVIVVPPVGRGARVLQRRQLYELIAASASSDLTGIGLDRSMTAGG